MNIRWKGINMNDNYNANQDNHYSNSSYNNSPQRHGVEPGNIVTMILLSIVTCGIYAIYWLYKIEEDTAKLTGEESEGTQLILLSIVTCSIYTFIWYYKLGQGRMKTISGKDNSMMYLILAIFGLSIVNLALIQTDINNYIEQGTSH